MVGRRLERVLAVGGEPMKIRWYMNERALRQALGFERLRGDLTRSYTVYTALGIAARTALGDTLAFRCLALSEPHHPL